MASQLFCFLLLPCRFLLSPILSVRIIFSNAVFPFPSICLAVTRVLFFLCFFYPGFQLEYWLCRSYNLPSLIPSILFSLFSNQENPKAEKSPVTTPVIKHHNSFVRAAPIVCGPVPSMICWSAWWAFLLPTPPLGGIALSFRRTRLHYPLSFFSRLFLFFWSPLYAALNSLWNVHFCSPSRCGVCYSRCKKWKEQEHAKAMARKSNIKTADKRKRLYKLGGRSFIPFFSLSISLFYVSPGRDNRSFLHVNTCFTHFL